MMKGRVAGIWVLLMGLVGLVGLVAAPQQTQAQDNMGVEPEVGPPGTMFSFYAEGFEDEERVSYWLNAPGHPEANADGIVGKPGYWTDADDDGEAEWSWRASSASPSGYYEMVAQGNSSGRTVLIPFQVAYHSERPGAPPESGAAHGVEPEVGRAGTVFDFYAEGFEDEERVGYWINVPGSSAPLGDIGFWTDADEDGRADWEWYSPDDAPQGPYTMVARGEESGIEHVIPFEIRNE